MNNEIRQNYAENRFEYVVDDYRATLAYCFPRPGVIEFTHTFVPEELGGRGIASALATAALAYARQRHLEATASCSFMQRYMSTHPDKI